MVTKNQLSFDQELRDIVNKYYLNTKLPPSEILAGLILITYEVTTKLLLPNVNTEN